MPTYKYIAKDDGGQEVTGTVEAKNREQVMGDLRKEGLQVIDIQEKSSFFSMQKKGSGGKVTLEEMVVFTRQLSTMISAGIPLLEALEILHEQQENKGFAYALSDVVDRVRAGSDFSAALSQHPKIFVKIYVSMVKAGEASGQLDVILSRLAEYQEATAKLIREIKSAMTYPCISLSLIFAITGFLMVYIIPQFKEIFVSLGIELPPITALLLQISDFMVNSGHWILLGIIGSIVGIMMYSKTPIGRVQTDWLKLKMPVFGTLFQKVALSRFARTFSTLIRSGVPILGALEIVGATSGNVLVERALQSSMQNVKEGEPLAEPLAQFWIFPPMVTRMISIGERSGALESLLEKISEFYDNQVEAAVETLTSMIEPIMIGVMGFVVGGIVLAVFMPIFKLQAQLSQSSG